MTRTNKHGKRGSRFNFTPEEQKRYLKELSVIYYRCLMGKATDREIKIAEKFSPSLIRKLETDFPMKPAAGDAEKEEKEMHEMWRSISGKLNIDSPLSGTGDSYPDEVYRRTWEAAQQRSEKRQTLPVRTLYRWTAVAAMIALVAGIFLYLGRDFNFRHRGEVATAGLVFEAINEPKDVTLEDGTKVGLNRESELIVSGTFNGELREVTMKGQIFFEVAKNPEKPFVVKTANINITVRGTSFEVMSYDGIDDKQVTVCTGKVEVANPVNGQLYAVLTPGSQLIVNSRTGHYEVKKVEAEDIAAWREGRLVLNSASVAELRLRVRQYFGKSIEIQNNALPPDAHVTSSFNHEQATVNNVMDRVCALFGAKYKIQDNRIIIYR